MLWLLWAGMSNKKFIIVTWLKIKIFNGIKILGLDYNLILDLKNLKNKNFPEFRFYIRLFSVIPDQLSKFPYHTFNTIKCTFCHEIEQQLTA
jgi:hypothetical protein